LSDVFCLTGDGGSFMFEVAGFSCKPL